MLVVLIFFFFKILRLTLKMRSNRLLVGMSVTLSNAHNTKYLVGN